MSPTVIVNPKSSWYLSPNRSQMQIHPRPLRPIVLIFHCQLDIHQSVPLCMSPLISLAPSSLNSCSSLHVPHVHSPLSPSYQPRSALPSSAKLVGNPDHRSTLFQLSPKFSPRVSTRSPRSLLLPQHSPSLPVKSPGSATPFVSLPLPFSLIENGKTAVEESWDDIRLDVDFMGVKPDSGRSFLVKSYG